MMEGRIYSVVKAVGATTTVVFTSIMFQLEINAHNMNWRHVLHMCTILKRPQTSILN